MCFIERIVISGFMYVSFIIKFPNLDRKKNNLEIKYTLWGIELKP